MLFLEKLKEKRIYIIFVIAICILTGIAYAIFFTPKEYMASTSIMLVKTEKKSNNEVEKNGTVELSSNLVSTYGEIIKSDSTIDKVKDNLNIEINNNELNKNIKVKKDSNSDTFKIIVKNINENEAINITEEIIKIFSKKFESMNSNADLYVIDEPHIISNNNQSAIIICLLSFGLLGILISASYILILIGIEKNVKTSLDIETELALKTLTLMPLKNTKNKKSKNNISELISYESEKSQTSKAFKKLRSNIQFINVNNTGKNIILVTSPNEKEGKSYIAANIAVSFAEVGKKVILIDADMRNGRQNKIFNIPNNLGLSNYLSNLDSNGIEINELTSKFINDTAIKNLNLITSGTIPPNPNELLASPRLMEMVKDLSVFYDVVIIDSTPTLTTIDPLILTRIANSTIIVSNYKNTKKDDLLKTKKDIQNVGGRIIGVIINKVKFKEEKHLKENVKDSLNNIKEKIKINLSKIKENIAQKKYEQKLLNETNEIIEKQVETTDYNLPENSEKNVVIESQINTFGTIGNFIKNKFDKNLKQENKINEAENQNCEIKQETLIEENTDKVLENDLNEKIDKEKISEQFKNNVNKLKNSSVELFNKTRTSINTSIEKIKTNMLEKNQNDDKELEIEPSNDIKKTEDEVSKNDDTVEKSNDKKTFYEEPQDDDTVLVIVDAENGFCRAFSKYCFTEKLVRGIDKLDGFEKAHYSNRILTKRAEGLMSVYGLTKSQTKRIDSFIYITLSDYDDCVWLERKMTSNKAESYVYCMAKEYEQEAGESNKDYLIRCQKLRKEELKKLGLEVEYKLENLWSSKKLNLTDKLVMKKFANSYDNLKIKKNVESKAAEDINKKKLSDLIEEKAKFIKNFKVEQVRAKSIKELENEIVSNRANNEKANINVEESKYELEPEEEKVNKNDEEINARKIEEEKQKEEKRKEKEVLKKIKKEKNALKKKENLEKKELKKAEAQAKKEEIKKNKEAKKQKQKEAARIEEELLEDNLYPKTKNNKSL